jgi:hypothetical protein
MLPVQPHAGGPPPAGPSLPEPASRLPWLLGGILAVAAAAIIVLVVVSLSGDDDSPPEDVATRSGFGDESAQRGGLDPVSPSSEETAGGITAGEIAPASDGPTPLGEPSEQPPPTASNLLMDGPGPALADLSAAIGDDTEVLEVIVYDTYVIVEYQNPGEPENVDRVIWRDGSVSDPEPVGFSDGNEADLFVLDDIDPARIPPLADRALEGFDVDGGEVTHVIVDRFFGTEDGSVTFRVYVSHPERGGGGYLLARLDGTVVDLVS